MNRTDACAVITVLKKVFLIFGDPTAIVSDNGLPFASAEFQEYCLEKDIELLHSPPYHPQSNGRAERWVQTVKLELEKLKTDRFSGELLDTVVFGLRNSPGADGLSPAQRIFSFTPRTQFEKLLPTSRYRGRRRVESRTFQRQGSLTWASRFL